MLEGAKLTKESDKKIRDMLCLHEVFRRVPNAVFNNPDGKFWDDYEESIKKLIEDKDINIDFQWKAKIGGEAKESGYMKNGFIIDASSLDGELRPGNPRLEEAYNMISLRPCIKDMELETSIYTNAIKEFPTMKHRDALYKACYEIYVAIDRDFYMFMSALDEYYHTNYVEKALDYIIETRRENKKYVEAEKQIDAILEKGIDGIREKIIEQEFSAYETLLKINHELILQNCKNTEGNQIIFKDYKGIDLTWADKRLPLEYTIGQHMGEGLVKLLEDIVGQYAIKREDFYWYIALLDKVDKYQSVEKSQFVMVFLPEIFYGLAYIKLKEGKYSSYGAYQYENKEIAG